MRTPKDITVAMPVSSRLGLVCVLCKNYSKSVSAMENQQKSNTRGSFQDPKGSFQDHRSNLDGKSLGKKHRGVIGTMYCNYHCPVLTTF